MNKPHLNGLWGILLVTIGVYSSAVSYAQTALPDDISIAPPSSTVAQNAAAFSGAWLGTWGGELPTALIVEQINSNGTAHVIYSWGDSKLFGFKTGWERETGKISNDRLQFSSPAGAKIDFIFEPSGRLSGRYELSNTPPSFAELYQIPTTNVSAILEAAKRPAVLWQEIRIPVHSQVGPTTGKTLMLQTTVYRQSSTGRHPVVIFNHGSTGPGIIPANYVDRGGNEALFFHSLGYVVAVPMRKGRGSSEGPYLEEDATIPASIGLDSAIEDLHAVVEYMSKQPDVDSSQIIVAGASRGGLLAAAYAGHYPTNVVGVINFSGGWFSEDMPSADFNFQEFRKSGHDAKVPMLWLFADHDNCYSLNFIEREFSEFRSAGGRGELYEVRDLPGDGHMLCLWRDKWRDKVTGYLNGINKKEN